MIHIEKGALTLLAATAIIVLILALRAPDEALQAPPAKAAVSRTSSYGLNGGIAGLGYSFFDPASGRRIVRLSVERVSRDFGRAGPFRVAWKPQLVLEGVTLEVQDTAGWKAVAVQLLSLERRNRLMSAIVIRNLTLRIPERGGLVLSARSACLTEAGDLALTGAAVQQGGAPTCSLASALVPLARPVAAVFVPVAQTGGPPSTGIPLPFLQSRNRSNP